jgi:transposase
MSASRKIVATARQKRKRHGTGTQLGRSPETGTLIAENDGLKKENFFLKNETEKLSEQLKFWRSECERTTESTEENHWRRRYSSRHQEAQRLEGLLALAKNYITELENDLAKKDAQIDKLRRALFESSSEKGPLSGAGDEPATSDNPAKPQSAEVRRRGGQPGTPRTGPRHHDHLPVEDERTYEIPESCCGDCGEQWNDVGSRDSEQVEVSVRAYRRKVRRKRYGHFCKKKNRWVTKTAAGPRRLFPHSKYAISVWVFLLVGKFVLHMAANRVRLLLKQHGLDIPPGTVSAGFERIQKLIKPLVIETKRYSREEKHHWHIDDTGWKVFVLLDEKNGFGWYLWVFLSDNVCVYILSPSRAREVPKSHLENSCGVVTSDRLASNKKLGDNIIHSFCWVHERRELRDLARAYPEIADTCNFFLNLIGSLFHHNRQRLLNEPGTAQFDQSEKQLAATLDAILENCQKELAKPKLHPELRRVLGGILKDWDGFHLFFDLRAVPPDNNPAERALRGPVVGRKNYYGCGSKWSAQFTADMFTLTTTLALNNVNPGQFLTEYLEACAANNGKAPPDAIKFLPWNRRPPPPQI